MQLSYNGLEALKEYEGFRDKAYKDTGGVWTIGYGTTVVEGQPVECGQTITLAKAIECLKFDCAWAQTAVNQAVRSSLKQSQFDALVSFVYNIGEQAFKASTLLRKLNAGDYAGAAKEFDRWVHDNGK
jgi:lysozyme